MPVSVIGRLLAVYVTWTVALYEDPAAGLNDVVQARFSSSPGVMSASWVPVHVPSTSLAVIDEFTSLTLAPVAFWNLTVKEFPSWE